MVAIAAFNDLGLSPDLAKTSIAHCPALVKSLSRAMQWTSPDVHRYYLSKDASDNSFGNFLRFCLQVRFTGGAPVGTGFWITGDDNDTLELCFERTNELPDLLQRAGFAARMAGGEWHKGSVRSRYAKLKNVLNVSLVARAL